MTLSVHTPVRWLGGKRTLTEAVSGLGARTFRRAHDPFVGGGSLALACRAESVYVSDTNEDLINFWRVNALFIDELIDALAGWSDDKETYLRIRASVESSNVKRAARFIYLNRTAYGGIWRTNTRGEFNVPYGGGGRYHFESLSSSLRAISRRTSHWTASAVDFRVALGQVEAGDLVLLDPPYGHSGDAPFRRYGAAQFSKRDHVELAVAAQRLVETGAIVLATLPDDPGVTDAYGFLERSIKRRRGEQPFEVVYASSNVMPILCPTGWSV